MVSGSISTPTIPVPGLSGWCRPSPGQREFHRGHPPAYVLVHPPWWLSGALPPALGYYDGSVAIQDTGEGLLQAIPQLHRSERRRGPLTTIASMIGLIVFCFTLGSMRRTTCPSRWIKPRIGGFSFSSVPRPHAPLSRRRRPARSFFGRPPGCPCARRQRRPHRPRPRRPASPREPWQPSLREDAMPCRGRHRRSGSTPWRSAGSTEAMGRATRSEAPSLR
jgi:hypothetical protein